MVIFCSDRLYIHLYNTQSRCGLHPTVSDPFVINFHCPVTADEQALLIHFRVSAGRNDRFKYNDPHQHTIFI